MMILPSRIPRSARWKQRPFMAGAALALALAALGLAKPAFAQVMIYRISLTHLEGYNVDFFDGGYLVTPALGGAPSLIMVNRSNSGSSYTSAVSGGEFFIGLGSDKRLMATYSCRGTGASALCAFGPVLSAIRLKSRSFDIQVRVARLLSGGAVVASSEGGEKGPTAAAVLLNTPRSSWRSTTR